MIRRRVVRIGFKRFVMGLACMHRTWVATVRVEWLANIVHFGSLLPRTVDVFGNMVWINENEEIMPCPSGSYKKMTHFAMVQSDRVRLHSCAQMILDERLSQLGLGHETISFLDTASCATKITQLRRPTRRRSP